jgi:hypothetical protein
VQKTIEREQAAFAIVVRAHDDDRVFDRNDDGDRPDHQRNSAEDFLGCRCRGPAGEQLIHCVKRRCADVAVNDAQRSEGQSGKATTRPMGRASQFRQLFSLARQTSNLS